MCLHRGAQLTYLGGEPGCSSSCKRCAARRVWDQLGGLELPRTSQDAGKAPFLLRNRSLCFLRGSHLHTHPNYLLAPQNAGAPGTQAALPRAALACNVLRAGGCEPRRRVLRAAGLLELSARHGQHEQLHTALSAKSREQALLYHCAGSVPVKCVYAVQYRPRLSICTQYRHLAGTTSSNGCKSDAVHRNLRKKQKQKLDFGPSFWTQWAQKGAE